MVQPSTHPLLTSMIPPLEVQDELLPHRLVSEGDRGREEKRVGTGSVPISVRELWRGAEAVFKHMMVRS